MGGGGRRAGIEYWEQAGRRPFPLTQRVTVTVSVQQATGRGGLMQACDGPNTPPQEKEEVPGGAERRFNVCTTSCGGALVRACTSDAD